LPPNEISRIAPLNRSAAVCGRGGTSRSTPSNPQALRLVEDDTARASSDTEGSWGASGWWNERFHSM